MYLVYSIRTQYRPIVVYHIVASFNTIGTSRMALYQGTIRTASGGETTAQVRANSTQQAKTLLEQQYGARNVPYLPKVIPG